MSFGGLIKTYIALFVCEYGFDGLVKTNCVACVNTASFWAATAAGLSSENLYTW